MDKVQRTPYTVLTRYYPTFYESLQRMMITKNKSHEQVKKRGSKTLLPWRRGNYVHTYKASVGTPFLIPPSFPDDHNINSLFSP